MRLWQNLKERKLLNIGDIDRCRRHDEVLAFRFNANGRRADSAREIGNK